MSRWRSRRVVAAWSVGAFTLAGCGGDDGPAAPPDPGPETVFPGTWTTAASLPEPVSHAAVAVLDGRIHVLGGLGADPIRVSARAFRYDPTANAWERIADLPEALMEPAAATVDGTLFLLGGNASGAGLAARGGVWTLDAGGGGWTLHSALPMESSSPVAALTDLGLHAAALGSFTVPPGDSTALLPRGAASWRGFAPQPFRPEHLLPDGGTLWAVGTAGLARLDPSSSAWGATLPLPTEGFLMGAWTLAGRVYVLQRIATRLTLRSRDAGGGQWEVLAVPTEALQRVNAMSVELDGRLYLIGGREAAPDQPGLARVDVFTPPG